MSTIKIEEIYDEDVIEISEDGADDAFFCCLVNGGHN